MDDRYVVIASAPCKHCSQDHGVYTYQCRPILFDSRVTPFKNHATRPPASHEIERGITWEEVQRTHA